MHSASSRLEGAYTRSQGTPQVPEASRNLTHVQDAQKWESYKTLPNLTGTKKIEIGYLAQNQWVRS